MKKQHFVIILVLWSILVSWFVIGPLLQEAKSTVVLGNPDLMSIGCGSGFTRALPHFCVRTVSSAGIALTSGGGDLNGTCQNFSAVTIFGVPSGTKRVSISASPFLFGANAIGLDSISVSFYNQAGCTTSQPDDVFMRVRETVAANNIELLRTEKHLDINLVSDLVYFNGTVSPGGSSSGVTLLIIGYYD